MGDNPGTAASLGKFLKGAEMRFKDFADGGKDFVFGGGFFILDLCKVQNNIPGAYCFLIPVPPRSGQLGGQPWRNFDWPR
jgi:hypothetical protein